MADDGAADVTAGGATEPEPPLRACLEAVLLVADEPVAEFMLAQVLERPREEVTRALRELASGYDADGRGFDLREVAGGWRFYTREEYAPVVERFVRDGQEVRLTQAALETLAVVAYRQPVSRSRVSAVRGVSCDGVMRTLTLRGLIEEAGTERETGAILFRTTGYFLERLGLSSLEDLPDLAPFLPEQVEDPDAGPGHPAGPGGDGWAGASAGAAGAGEAGGAEAGGGPVENADGAVGTGDASGAVGTGDASGAAGTGDASGAGREDAGDEHPGA